MSEKVFIRLREVQALAGGSSRTTLWRWMRDGQFPKSYKIGPNTRAWLRNQVLDWVKSKTDATYEDLIPVNPREDKEVKNAQN